VVTDTAENETAFAAWSALGMLIQLVVTDPASLPAARELLDDDLAALDLACSRFRPDSELVAVGNAARGASAPVTVSVSPLLAEAVAVSLRAARLTDGDVDPTVGGALAALGYDRDYAELPAPAPELPAPACELPAPAPAAPAPADPVPDGVGDHRARSGVPNDPLSFRGPRVIARAIPGWRSVAVDVEQRRLTVPAGVGLDLGATVKGWAADRSAVRIAGELGCGVLVSLGGDTAVAGEPPAGGWRIRVQDKTGPITQDPGSPSQVIAITDGGLATSSVTARRWRHGGDVVHHILDPRTGTSAAPVWRTVSVAAGTCADANTAATAAIIRGRRALSWLASLKLPARLVGADGSVMAVAGWPASALPAQCLTSTGSQRREESRYSSSSSQARAAAAVQDWCRLPSGAPVSGW
jgi:thiamine biosynthesis lipoprotein ApbE